jgi:ribosomal protein S18 acetylase RimI-like enzyme
MVVAALSIRRARSEDAPLLAAAERAIAIIPGRLASRPDELHDEAFRKTIVDLNDRGRGNYLVAEREGTVVGHALLEPLPLAVTSHVVRLTIAVHEGHQRQGVGRALMNELLAWARSSPLVEKAELQVRASNAGAIALYRSLGFVEEGRKTKRLKIGPNQYIDDVYMALWVGARIGEPERRVRVGARRFTRLLTLRRARLRDGLLGAGLVGGGELLRLAAGRVARVGDTRRGARVRAAAVDAVERRLAVAVLAARGDRLGARLVDALPAVRPAERGRRGSRRGRRAGRRRRARRVVAGRARGGSGARNVGRCRLAAGGG